MSFHHRKKVFYPLTPLLLIRLFQMSIKVKAARFAES